jgi:nickel transport system ATP-binding protein
LTRLVLESLHLSAQGQPLVQDVSLVLERGRVLGLTGQSGSGRMLHGQAVLDTAGMKALRGRVVGLVQQAPRTCFNPLMTIGRHFSETLALAGLPRQVRTERARKLLMEVGFESPAELLPAYSFQLSGGMLQRIMVALALARDPDFLLADEPTTDLDLVVQAGILSLLERLVAHRGLGLLLVTHDLSVMARLADTVAVMDKGRIVEQQAVHGFFDAPEHPASLALLLPHLALYGEALP